MTLDELVERLEDLQALGHGAMPVAVYDYGEHLVVAEEVDIVLRYVFLNGEGKSREVIKIT